MLQLLSSVLSFVLIVSINNSWLINNNDENDGADYR